MNHEEAKADRQLDPQELDVNALEQADLYGKWAERAAIAKGEEEALEWKVELKEAELQGAIRRDPGKYGLDSVTEASIKAAAKAHRDYIVLKDKYLAARLEAMLLDKMEKAMAQRKGMIEELIRLHGQQYFAGPAVPRDIMSAWQMHRAAKEAATGDRLRDRMRKRSRTEGQ